MVSVIVPVYNCKNYIHKCVYSILSQECQDIEVILVDDGSTDGTSAILDKMANNDSKVRVYHISNGGPSKARNFGLTKSNGEWIMFVDSDDWIDSDLLSVLKQYPYSDIIYFGYKNINDDGSIEYKSIGKDGLYIKENEIDKLLSDLYVSKESFFGFTVNKIFKKEIIDRYKIRFRENIFYKEDELFCYEYIHHIKSLAVSSLTPYNYRILGNSLSHKKKYLHHEILADSFLKLFSNNTYYTFENHIKKAVMGYYINSITESIEYKEKNDIYSAIERSIEYYELYRFKDLPKWQWMIYNIPYRKLKKTIIYLIFYMRGLIK